MKTLARLLFLCATALLVAACVGGPQVKSDYDHTANFASYRTFGYFEPLGTDKSGYSTLVTQTMKSAVRQELESRGYTYTESNPDLLVNFNGKLEKQTSVTQFPSMVGAYGYYGYRGGYYGPWGGYGYETYVDQYTEGTVNVDIIDAQRKQLVWEGVAVGRVTKEHEANRDAALRATVTEIFSHYPFRAGGG
jgi:hypothetical protein